MASLTNATTVLELPDGLLWQDEFRWTRVEQRRRYSITGALHVSASIKQAGRPITLTSGAWLTRVQVQTLRAWSAAPGQRLTLSYRSTPYEVIFDQENVPVDASMVQPWGDAQADDVYSATLRFLEV